ncbi:MAG: pyruvate carboxylase subunit B [Fibrobacter sp.]|nr:pyruvate carboxylase subunit B [Fibrobacter sp.]
MTTKTKTEEKIPLRITDTTLRDAHQSLWATRMRTEDIMRIVDVIDNAGYYSLECWGGATFDVCLRFLRENPWERLRMIKSKAKNTPLQMLLRGQNLVGYKNYADDVVDRFVALSCQNGIDIFRVFDALNDTRNLEAAIKAVKKHGGHAQGTLCYTISPVHTIEKFVKHAKDQVALGVDSIVIKDMAGILSPVHAEKLVGALVKDVGVPIQVHSHASSGMAMTMYTAAAYAGAGAIDCAISSMAGTSSQPPVETMVAIFAESKFDTGLDLDALGKIAKYFDELAPKRRQNSSFQPYIDPGILVHQIPGGMISNFRSQLDQQKALDKLPLVLDEVSRVREDLGYPPLVTPTSQIVGTQAVMNIIAGERYKMVPNEVKEYCRGMYGRSPAPIKPEFIKKILGDEKPIDYRPADKIAPMLPKATDDVDPKFIEHEEDIVSYVMLPEPALEYFKYRATPVEQRPETPADLELKKQEKKDVAPAPVPAAPAVDQDATPAQTPVAVPGNFQSVADELLGKIEGLTLDELIFRKGDFTIAVRPSGVPAVAASHRTIHVSTPSAQPVAAPAPAKAAAPVAPAAAPVVPVAEVKPGKTINAPIGGKFYTSAGPGKPKFCKEGDVVDTGGKVCIVEAMKLFNEIATPTRCKIVKFLVPDGTTVEKDQPLVSIEEI